MCWVFVRVAFSPSALPLKGEETAAGQVMASELRDTYRIEMVDAATQVYGVAGDPVAHSISPIMMNAAFRRETVNAVYLALHAKTLKDLLTCVHEIPIRGLSITMPYKQQIVDALANSDELTKQIGACNTMVRAQDGKLYGFNTDVAGIVVPLEQRMTLQGAKILIVGAGGVARAAAFGLKNKGAEVFITNRTAEKGQALARQSKTKYMKRADVAKASFDVIINATPLGMGANKQTPLEEKELNTKYLFDLVYTPAETKLMKMAKAKNIQVIPGLEMFVQQGARQFEIWAGKPAPVADMAFVVSKALERIAAQSEEEGLQDRTALRGPARQACTRAGAQEGCGSGGQKEGEGASCETREKSGEEDSQALSHRGRCKTGLTLWDRHRPKPPSNGAFRELNCEKRGVCRHFFVAVFLCEGLG